MESTKNYFLVGLFVLLTLAAGIGFTLWLTEAGKGETMRYRIYFTDSVSGLKSGSMVKFHGVDVGTVKSMAIDPKDARRVRVEIEILKSAPVTESTLASMEVQGLSGNNFIELSGGEANEPRLADSATHETPEIRAGPSHSITSVVEHAQPVFDKLNHAAGQLNKVLSNENVRGVNKVVKGLSKTFGSDDDEEEKDKFPEKEPQR